MTDSPTLHRLLLGWYAEHKRDLPWRVDRDPYRIWISEAMLQQTRVETVLPYYSRFMARFPTIDALAQAPIEDVLAAWSGLGYYRRARTLHAAARTIVAEHAATFPREREALLALPGIGPYTAGAIASIAFEAREPIVDGNVARVFCRLFGLAGDPSSSQLNAELWSRALSLLPSAGSCGDWNQALMELGALVCTPRDPRCNECPLRSECRALAEDRVSALPWPKPQPAMIPVELEVMIVASGDRWLLEQRPAIGRMADMWQLPTLELLESAVPIEKSVNGGHLHPTRWPAGIDIRANMRLGEIRHTITRHKIRATVYSGIFDGRAHIKGSVELARTGLALRTQPRQGVEHVRNGEHERGPRLDGNAKNPNHTKIEPLAGQGSTSDGGIAFAWFERRAITELPLTGMARKVLRARFLAILAAPQEARSATSSRRSPSNNISND